MENERRNYVAWYEDKEIICKMSLEQAKAIEWFCLKFKVDGFVELAEDYEGEEI